MEWWRNARDLRTVDVPERAFDGCELELGPAWQIGDGDPQIRATMTPLRLQARKACNVTWDTALDDIKLDYQTFDWTEQFALVVAAGKIVTCRLTSSGTHEAFMWITGYYPGTAHGVLDGRFCVGLAGDSSGNVVAGDLRIDFGTAAEMYEFMNFEGRHS